MICRSAGAPGRARRALAAALTVAILAGLPASVVAEAPAGSAATPDPGAGPVVAGVSTVDAIDPSAGGSDATQAGGDPASDPADAGVAAGAPDLRAFRVAPGDAPSQMYEDLAANASRQYDFVPGGRVTVAFTPRADDRWPVGGAAPSALAAGRESGAEMAGPAVSLRDASTPAPDPSPPAGAARQDFDGGPSTVSREPLVADGPDASAAPAGPAALDPSPIAAEDVSLVVPGAVGAAAPAAAGMRREVYGFLPYWEVADADTRLDFSILTHVAYFSVGADARGNLAKRNSDGSLTTGWAGWTSSRMTSIINAAHKKRSRVTLTLSVFAWTSGQATTQKALLGSSAARANLARQAVAAVRDRGADGINLDFEPLVSGYEDEFVALVRTMRAELSRVGRGYHLSFDTLGYPGNYPLEKALASGGADAVFIMGYDYRTSGSSYAGSIDPLAGPAYDLADTVRAYVARVPASRLILGIPYYGRAWSTVSADRNARTQTGAKYGYSAAVSYAVAAEYAADHGRRYDGREVAAWTAYRKESCTSAYGCVTTWRQIYYDDAATLKARYDLINRAGLRGAGIWALGYDGARKELYRALADKFLHDTTAPLAGIVAFPAGPRPSEGFVVRWRAGDDWSGVASHDVQVSVDGGPWINWQVATKATSAVYLGTDNHAYAFRSRARDGKGNVSAWNVTSVPDATPSLGKGGFVRVTADSLNLRSAPATDATRVSTASAGEVYAITGGPVSEDGYTWVELEGPLETWGPVDDTLANVWAAVSGSGSRNADAIQAPNAVVVGAGIRAVGFGKQPPAASIGTSAAAVGTRSFSPNGDGSADVLAIAWNNRRAYDALSLRVLRPDGTLLGSRALSTTAAGPQDATWDGTADGTALPDGTYVLQLVGTSAGATYAWPADDATAVGLAARVGVTIDRVAPTLETSKATGNRLSPNGDGAFDGMTIGGKGSKDVVRWEVLVAPLAKGVAGERVRRISGHGRTASTTWDGMADGGAPAPDGTYRVTLRMLDAAGNAASRSWSALVDATPPTLKVAAAPAAFSPDGDGTDDAIRLTWSSTEALTGTLKLMRGTTVVRSWPVSGTGGRVSWTGRDATGRIVRDGRLRVVLGGADALTNRASASATVTADRTAGWLRWSSASFFPQDGDRLAATATVSVRLERAARLTLRILDASGAEVRRAWTGRRAAAGIVAWRWDGKSMAGDWAPQGRYVAELTAVGAYGTTVLRRTIYAGGFVATPSTTAPRPGATLTVVFRSVEPLAGAPTARFAQVGRPVVPMTVVRLADGSWRARVTVAAGAPGKATVSILGRDAAGSKNRASLVVTVP